MAADRVPAPRMPTPHPLNLPEDAAWVAEQWDAVLGSPVTSLDADFFAYGGGSLAAAQLVSALRVRYPTITVADIYATPADRCPD